MAAKRKRRTPEAAAGEAEPVAHAADAGPATVPAPPVPARPRKKVRRRQAQAAAGEAELEEQAGRGSAAEAEAQAEAEAGAGEEQANKRNTAEAKAKAKAEAGGAGGEEAPDRRGIVHLGSVPAFMGADKVRHLMEQFGEVGRVYLQPEDKTEAQRRRRAGGNRKQRFTEGWVEFADRRLARRVALTLNGTTIGGKKRHNFFRDDLWNLQYLPRFKWHQLKEASIYNRHVRKARLEQKISQARRENDFFLERVEQAKRNKKIAEKRAAKGRGGPELSGGGGAELPRGGRPNAREGGGGGDGGAWISDRVLDSLF